MSAKKPGSVARGKATAGEPAAIPAQRREPPAETRAWTFSVVASFPDPGDSDDGQEHPSANQLTLW
jgi:hypothetical protein